jgi:hypothetical protein
MKCPICRQEVDPASLGRPGSAFPFCSDRCRLIDLGRWLDGRYQVPVREEDDAIDESTPPSASPPTPPPGK